MLKSFTMTDMDIRRRYLSEEYDLRVIEYMDLLLSSLEKEYGYVKKEWIISLDMIAQNYQIYILSYDDIKNNGIYVLDHRDHMQRNPSISLMTNAQTQILRLVNSFALTPMSYSKVRKLETADTSDDYIDSLCN